MISRVLTASMVASLILSSSVLAQPTSADTDQDTCARLNALKQERAEMAKSYTEAYPPMRQLKQMIEQLTSAVLEENSDADVDTLCSDIESAREEQQPDSESSEDSDK